MRRTSCTLSPCRYPDELRGIADVHSFMSSSGWLLGRQFCLLFSCADADSEPVSLWDGMVAVMSSSFGILILVSFIILASAPRVLGDSVLVVGFLALLSRAALREAIGSACVLAFFALLASVDLAPSQRAVWALDVCLCCPSWPAFLRCFGRRY